MNLYNYFYIYLDIKRKNSKVLTITEKLPDHSKASRKLRISIVRNLNSQVRPTLLFRF